MPRFVAQQAHIDRFAPGPVSCPDPGTRLATHCDRMDLPCPSPWSAIGVENVQVESVHFSTSDGSSKLGLDKARFLWDTEY